MIEGLVGGMREDACRSTASLHDLMPEQAPADAPMAVKSRWSLSLRKWLAQRCGSFASQRPPSSRVRVLHPKYHTQSKHNHTTSNKQ